ncbi:MAG: hypothetical protein [Arizlama microvirus]|nr:MAG: hypothetical protein [Arizlama microvirus]
MSMSFQEVMKALAKAKRDRELVKSAPFDEAVRAKLLAEIDAYVATFAGKASTGEGAPAAGPGAGRKS